jgi:hypothetical protein
LRAVATIVSIWLALALALAAALKARRPAGGAAALATYGIVAAPLQRAALWTLVAIEAALAGALFAGVGWAAAVAGLAVAIFALAREVGVLRLSAASRGALEIPEEGPALGARQSWASAVQSGPRTALGLAVFTSEGCPLCATVAPAVRHVAADPLLAVAIFDEHADAPVWRAAGVPGSPYAVALSGDGVALAKGTFNSLGQLESVLATARVRQPGLALAA